MFKVLLITTEGCAGCAIMDSLIASAINEVKSARDITYISKDYKECSKELIIENDITDFPTTLIIRNNVVLYKHIGTTPKFRIIEWLLKYFNK